MFRLSNDMSPGTRTPPPTFTTFLVWKLWWLRRILNVKLLSMSNTVGIPEAGIELILELMQAPDGLKQRDLADSLRLRNSTISVAIKKLLAAGLVRRARDAADDRAWRVTLQSDAHAKRVSSQLEWYEESLTEKYTKEELALVGRVLDDWILLLKGDTWLPW